MAREPVMSDRRLLWVMLAKEIRSTFRERSQVKGIIVSLVMIFLIGGNAYFRASRGVHRNTSPQAPGFTMPAPDGAARANAPPTPERILLWAAIAGTAGIGFFFSLGYLSAGVLACFVGEKEGRTLEVLLASPLSDRKLFFVKAVSVLGPSACIGVVMTVIALVVATASGMQELIHFSVPTLMAGLALGVPALVLIQSWVVGIGAAISAKAETMKGAGQTLGVVMMVFIFGSLYGVPMLLAAYPGIKPALIAQVMVWLDRPFATQYTLTLAILAIPSAACIGLGRTMFRRDRMLT